MKKIGKSFVAIVLVFLMMFSTLAIVATAESASDGGTGTGISDDNPTRAYELVWKYRLHNGVYQKRRWNNTLGKWYDPYWINVG